METRLQRSATVVVCLLAAACQSASSDVEERRSAVVNNSHQMIFVPAYFYPDQTDSWDRLISVAHQGKISAIVVNAGCESIPAAVGPGGSCQSPTGIDGGPGTDYDSRLQDLIGRLQGDGLPAGVAVYGYVSFKQGRPAADIQTDIDNWSYGANHRFSNYYSRLDGIFFDESDRPSSAGLPKALYFNDQVQHHFVYGAAWMPDSNIPG
jgi:hypothetical protein